MLLLLNKCSATHTAFIVEETDKGKLPGVLISSKDLYIAGRADFLKYMY
jgi:hypothetical protein